MFSVCKTEATMMKSEASAKYRPAQILDRASISWYSRPKASQRGTCLRPKPKNHLCGSRTLGFGTPSRRNRSGLKSSGSGYSLSSRDIALETPRRVSAGHVQRKGDVPCIWDQYRPLRDEVSAHFNVFARDMRDTEYSNIVPSKALLYNRLNVREVRSIRKVGEAAGANDRVEFGLCFLLHIGVHSHGQEERLHRRECLVGSAMSVSRMHRKREKYEPYQHQL